VRRDNRDQMVYARVPNPSHMVPISFQVKHRACLRLAKPLLGLASLLVLPWTAVAQALDIHDAIRTHTALPGTEVTLSGRAELRLTGTGDPLAGSVVHLDSPDAWLLLAQVPPSDAVATQLPHLRVNGAPALLDDNVRVAQYGQGSVIIPHGPGFAPLQVFDGRYFTGPARRLASYRNYDDESLGVTVMNLGSFKLKRGYMATLANQENGNGFSRCYVAQDGDLEVGRLPAALENNVHFIRIFPWRWASKKGIAGNIESGLNVQWLYNWNLDRNSPLDWEYVPIRQNRYWPDLNQDWQARGATHLLGYNEPDRPDQANLAVGDAIWSWPDVLWPGLRVGAPAVSDGGLNWLYDFMAQADAAGLRVDFVPVHYYRCHGNAGDPNGTANQFYNFLKGIYDVVQRPLWVTEWNNGANWTGCADPSFSQQEAAIAAMIDMLDNAPFVERYALYNWVEDVRRLKWDDGSLTAAGVVYRDQNAPLAYRQEMADAGIGSSAVYSFDDDTHDGWGNGQDAMRIGAPLFLPGRYGSCLSLNGSTDYLQISPRVGDSTDWSFAGWVWWNGGGDWQRIFDAGWDTTRFAFLTPRSGDGTLRFGIQFNGTQQQLNATPLPVGVWTHVAVTLSGNTGKLFVNGQVADINTQMTHNPGDLGTQHNYLGKSLWPADPLFSGRFDEFRFASSAFSDAQILAMATLPPARFNAPILRKPDAPVLQPYADTLAGDATGSGTLTFSKMDGPSWLSVATNGTLSGTPSFGQGGLNRFRVRVTDVLGSLHTASLEIHVPNLLSSVSAGADDAEQAASGAVNLTSSDLELVLDDETGAGTQMVGVRFDSLPIPQGAVVVNAFIQFRADETQDEPTSLLITTEAADDAVPFRETDSDLSSRLRVPYEVPWQPVAWTAGQSTAAQRTPNLAGLVQEVVTRPGWSSDNAIAFLITGTGHRTAESFDNPNGFPARLSIQYVPSTPRLRMRAGVATSADDAEESGSGVVNLTSTDLELVTDGTETDQTIGVRLSRVDLPAGIVLAGATLQFATDETQSDPTTLSIRAEASDNAGAFTKVTGNLTSRPTTSSSATWSPAPWPSPGERGPLQRTPDLSPLVREVITRPGWANGNAMAFLIQGAGHRTADAVDKPGGFPPMLTVDYWLEPPLGTFARWAPLHGNPPLVGVDQDGDGYETLFEYSLGLDPESVNRNVTSLVVNGPWIEVTYSRPVDVTDVAYHVEWADTLGAPWASTGVRQQIIQDDGNRRTILTRQPRGSGGQRFVRLRVAHQGPLP